MNKLDEKDLNKVTGGTGEYQGEAFGAEVSSDALKNYKGKKIYAVDKTYNNWVRGTVGNTFGNYCYLKVDKTSTGGEVVMSGFNVKNGDNLPAKYANTKFYEA